MADEVDQVGEEEEMDQVGEEEEMDQVKEELVGMEKEELSL